MRTIRFFLCLAFAVAPMLVVALIGKLGGHPTRSDAAWSIICTCLLLGFLAYLVLRDRLEDRA